jgi:hypothetical protein
VTIREQSGQASLYLVFAVGVIGLLTSLLTFLAHDSLGAIDPVLVFLLVAYPFLIGASVYFHLQWKQIAPVLQEEYYIKWFLQGFAKVCLAEPNLTVIREELANTILRLIKPALVMVYELDPQTNRLQMIQRAGIKSLPDAAAQGYTFGEGIPGWVMHNQNTVILADIAKEQYLQIDPWARTLDFRSYAAVPIVVGTGSVGIIAMYSMEPNFFQDSNLIIAQITSQIYGLSLAGPAQS